MRSIVTLEAFDHLALVGVAQQEAGSRDKGWRRRSTRRAARAAAGARGGQSGRAEASAALGRGHGHSVGVLQPAQAHQRGR